MLQREIVAALKCRFADCIAGCFVIQVALSFLGFSVATCVGHAGAYAKWITRFAHRNNHGSHFCGGGGLGHTELGNV